MKGGLETNSWHSSHLAHWPRHFHEHIISSADSLLPLSLTSSFVCLIPVCLTHIMQYMEYIFCKSVFCSVPCLFSFLMRTSKPLQQLPTLQMATVLTSRFVEHATKLPQSWNYATYVLNILTVLQEFLLLFRSNVQVVFSTPHCPLFLHRQMLFKEKKRF